MITNSPRLSVAGFALLLVFLCGLSGAATDAGEGAACDVKADYFLAAENYAESILLHLQFLRKHPASALAHYHLGFAWGMAGDKTEELREYRRAVALGLARWDLFLNTGLVLLESGNLEAATQALRLAVRLGANQSESHFNLGLIYGRPDMLAEAGPEML